MAARIMVVPVEPFVDITGDADVMMIGVAVTAQDVDEPSADATHAQDEWHFAGQRGFSMILQGVLNRNSGVRRFERTAGSDRQPSHVGEFAVDSRRAADGPLACLAEARAKRELFFLRDR